MCLGGGVGEVKVWVRVLVRLCEGVRVGRGWSGGNVLCMFAPMWVYVHVSKLSFYKCTWCEVGARVEQQRVQAELDGLQRTLEAKEAQMARMVGGRGQITAMKQHYDRVLADLQSERDELARERAQLVKVHPLSVSL